MIETDIVVKHRIWRWESAFGTASFPERIPPFPRDIRASAVSATGHPHIFVRTAAASEVIREHDTHGDGWMSCSRRKKEAGRKKKKYQCQWKRDDVVSVRTFFIPTSEEPGAVLIINTSP